MEIQKAYKEKFAAQLKTWSAEINLLEARLDGVTADLRIKRAEELQELRSKQHAASEKMKELGHASGEAWEQVKITADNVWDELKTGLAEAKARFK